MPSARRPLARIAEADPMPGDAMPESTTNVQIAGRRPDPDPTTLTTQQLLREIAMLEKVIEARLIGIEREATARGDVATAEMANLATSISKLQELFEVRFRSIDALFRESATAVDAALAAAKEAVVAQTTASERAIAKSEMAFTKQIDQNYSLTQQLASGLSDKIDDLKVRLTLIEGRAGGRSDLWGYALGVVMALVAIGALIVAVTK